MEIFEMILFSKKLGKGEDIDYKKIFIEKRIGGHGDWESFRYFNYNDLDLPNGKGLVFIEGGIGVGKSTLIEFYFPDEKFIKVYEPIDEMKAILKKFYDGEIEPETVSKEISSLCMKVFLIGVEKAKEENKNLVVERVPWMHEWVFKFSTSMSITKFDELRANATEGIKVDDPDFNNVLSDLNLSEPIEDSAKGCVSLFDWSNNIPRWQEKLDDLPFKEVILILVEANLEDQYSRIHKRDRKCESSITKEYIEFINFRTYSLTNLARKMRTDEAIKFLNNI